MGRFLVYNSDMKLGKLPARKGAVTFKLSTYGASLPAAPAKGGHYNLVSDWQGMLGNDQLGDCVCAEAGHGTIYLNKLAKQDVSITTANVVAMYSDVTGYTPKDPNSDQGTDMQAAASYRRKTGILDAHGNRHKILAYLSLGAANKDNLKKAIHYFGNAGIGFQFPNYAMDEFNAGQTWHVKSGGTIDGGHDVLACGYDSRYIYCVSWGKVIRMTWGFFLKYCDESLVYLSGEMFTGGKSLEGFDLATLQADLARL